jgi:hypothetical protein
MAIKEFISLEGVEQVEAALQRINVAGEESLKQFRDLGSAGGGSQEFDGLKPTDSLEPVADRVGGWRARRVVASPALNQIGLVGVAEEDEGGTIVGGLAVTGNLPSFLQHGADRRRVFGRGRGVNRQCE